MIEHQEFLIELEKDVYIPDYLALEFNGLYWHSEFGKDKNYHLNKTLLCKEQDIENKIGV